MMTLPQLMRLARLNGFTGAWAYREARECILHQWYTLTKVNTWKS